MDKLLVDIVSITYEPNNTRTTDSTYINYELEQQLLVELLKSFFVVHITNLADYNKQLEWCFEFCTGRFRDVSLTLNNEKNWYFENSEDALLFAMKWS
jgi:hypothetical protein